MSSSLETGYMPATSQLYMVCLSLAPGYAWVSSALQIIGLCQRQNVSSRYPVSHHACGARQTKESSFKSHKIWIFFTLAKPSPIVEIWPWKGGKICIRRKRFLLKESCLFFLVADRQNQVDTHVVHWRWEVRCEERAWKFQYQRDVLQDFFDRQRIGHGPFALLSCTPNFEVSEQSVRILGAWRVHSRCRILLRRLSLPLRFSYAFSCQQASEASLVRL